LEEKRRLAKLIIKLINSVADVVNNNPDVCDRLKVVSWRTTLCLWSSGYHADLSGNLHGKEASGTGKFALNHWHTDGANIEIREAVELRTSSLLA